MGAAIGVGLGLAALNKQSGSGSNNIPFQGPVVINTWFPNACQAAYNATLDRAYALDAVELGCTVCEVAQCDGTVGWGGSPDSSGETTLDAMIMDGTSMDAGAVAYLRNVKSAISAARKVLHYTGHTVLAGQGATNFSATWLPVEDLHSNSSVLNYAKWLNSSCQPNYYLNFVNVNTSCPPYVPVPTPSATPMPQASTMSGARKPRPANPHISQYNHDTIGMCVLDVEGNLAAGGSSNGANHKVAGRVGDVPIVGAAIYVDQTAGCAAATGDGDITMRFLPAYQAVEFMRSGMAPADACAAAVRRIMRVYGTSFAIGLVCLNPQGQTGAASQGWTFTYAMAAPSTGGQAVSIAVPPLPAL